MFRFAKIPLAATPFVLALASCDVSSRIATPESGVDTIGLGESVVGRLAADVSGDSRKTYRFRADSGKAYVFSWNDSGHTVEIGVAWGGQAQYLEVFGGQPGFERSVLFPALKSGACEVAVTGPANSRFQLDLRISDKFPEWVSFPDRWEDDDLRSAATPLPLDSSWQARTFTTSAIPDVDWLWFQADSGYTYDLAIEDSLPGEVAHGFYDSDSQYLGSDGFTAVRKERVYLRIAAPTAKGGAYRVRALARKGFTTGFPAQDAYEDDDDLHSARFISTDSVWQERTTHRGADLKPNPDFIRFHAESGTTYRVYVQNENTRFPAYMAGVVDVDSAMVPQAVDTSVKGRLMLTVPCLRTGDLFVLVEPTDGAWPYRIAVAESSGLPAWAVPDRDRFDTALVPTDSSVHSRTLLASDTEWVKFRAEKGKAYRVRLENKLPKAQSVPLSLLVLDPGMLLLKQAVVGAAGVVERVVQTEHDGFCYLRVFASFARNSAAVPHEIRINEIAGGFDPMEPDESPARAKLLDPNGTVVTRWYSRSDTDWMRIQVDSGKPVSLNAWQLEATTYDASMSLYTRDMRWVQSSSFFANRYGILDYLPTYSGVMYLCVSNYDEARRSYAIVNQRVVDIRSACDSFSRACPIAVDSAMRDVSVPGYSTRWFAMKTDSGEVYQLDLQSNDYSYLLLSDTGKKALASFQTNTVPKRSFFVAKASGTLFLSVGQTWSSKSVEMSIRISRVAGLLPGGKVVSQAHPLDPRGGGGEGLLVGAGSKTLFRFRADSGVVYVFGIVGDGATKASILTTDSVIAGPGVSDGKTRSAVSFSSSKTQDVLLELDNLSREDNRWSLRCSAFRPDAFEPDDGMDAARGLPADGAIRSGNLAGPDVDWISMDVDSGVVYDLGMKTNGRLEVALFSDDSLKLRDSIVVAPATTNPIATISPRRHTKVYVRVRSPDPYGASVVEYGIWAEKRKVVVP